MFDIHSIAEKHALDIIDGSHLISKEGLDLWIQNFALATQGEKSNFKIEIQ